MTKQQQKNPARGFLIMAGFNLAAALAFILFYFLYRGSGGEDSYYLLIASLVSGSAAIALVVLYNNYKNKF